MSFIPVRIDDQLIGMAVDADQPLHPNLQACFLEDFPLAGLCRRLTRFHSTPRQTPLPIISATREQDSALVVEDRSRTSQSNFALFTQTWTIKNLCHVLHSFTHSENFCSGNQLVILT